MFRLLETKFLSQNCSMLWDGSGAEPPMPTSAPLGIVSLIAELARMVLTLRSIVLMMLVGGLRLEFGGERTFPC